MSGKDDTGQKSMKFHQKSADRHDPTKHRRRLATYRPDPMTSDPAAPTPTHNTAVRRNRLISVFPNGRHVNPFVAQQGTFEVPRLIVI